jgi:hypothetical protein
MRRETRTPPFHHRSGKNSGYPAILTLAATKRIIAVSSPASGTRRTDPMKG